jgi:hypothetical protein
MRLCHPSGSGTWIDRNARATFAAVASSWRINTALLESPNVQ